MDDPQTTAPLTGNEITHAAQELYKKNLELTEKNKLLTLLQKIEEIILGSVTDLHQVAQNIVDVAAASEEFLGVALHLVDKSKNILSFLTVSKTETVEKSKLAVMHDLFPKEIKLDNYDFPAVKAITTKSRQVVDIDLAFLLKVYQEGDAKKLLELGLVKTLLIYPMVVKDTAIGVIVFLLNKPVNSLNDNQKDLIERLVGVIGIAIDNALLYHKIKIANIQLLELDKAKDEFFSIASHELRTPLTAIQGNTSMILDYFDKDIKDPSMREMLDDVLQSSARLIKIVNEFLDMSRLEQGKMLFVPKHFDLPELIRGLIHENKSMAHKQNSEIAYDGPQSLVINCDPDRVTQVIINLMSNSIKHSQGGLVTIKLENSEASAIVHVIDTGSGISGENQKNLFRKFRQASGDALARDTSQGTGLGLYIAKLLVENMNGTIWLEGSELGKGADFAFKIPLGI